MAFWVDVLKAIQFKFKKGTRGNTKARGKREERKVERIKLREFISQP